MSGSDQRKYPRLEIDLPVFVVGPQSRAKGRLTNVSLGGCQVEGELAARPGEVVAILCGIKRPDRGFRAKVVWSVPGEGKVSFGGAFWGADERERRELVHSLISIARPGDARDAHLLIG